MITPVNAHLLIRTTINSVGRLCVPLRDRVVVLLGLSVVLT